MENHRSPCCNDKIGASLADGVLLGSCVKCHKDICRRNPRTGALEWLDGKSPWTNRDDLRPMTAKTSPKLPAFLLVLVVLTVAEMCANGLLGINAAALRISNLAWHAHNFVHYITGAIAGTFIYILVK